MNSLLALWAIALAMLLLALAGLLWPLLREPAAVVLQADPGGSERLRRLYRAQRDELEREHQRQSLSAEDRAEALEELERRLLNELDQLARLTDRALPDGCWQGRVAAGVLSVLLPLGALGLYLQVGDPIAAATLATTPSDNHTAAGADAEAMVARLEERLRLRPDDLEGWMVLARSRDVMEQYDAATLAYRHALELAERQQAPVGLQARLHADLADALASARGGALDAPVLQMLQRALALDPAQPKALALAGTAAVRQGDLEGARAHWQRLLALLEPGSDMALRVQSDLDRLGGTMGVKDASPRPAAAVGSSLSGTVVLDRALRERVRPDDTVFVVVRTPSMGRMPVAMLRLTAAQLPARFALDDSHAMSPELPLSRFEQLTIEVRISRSASTKRAAGEPISPPLSVQPGSRDLVLTVDRLEPSAAAAPLTSGIKERGTQP